MGSEPQATNRELESNNRWTNTLLVLFFSWDSLRLKNIE